MPSALIDFTGNRVRGQKKARAAVRWSEYGFGILTLTTSEVAFTGSADVIIEKPATVSMSALI